MRVPGTRWLIPGRIRTRLAILTAGVSGAPHSQNRDPDTPGCVTLPGVVGL